MANASKDENGVSTLIAVSSADGRTPVTVYANPTTHRLLTEGGGGGSGDVTGPASSTDNGVVRFDGTTGKIIQNSSNVVIDDSGNLGVGLTNPATKLQVVGGSNVARLGNSASVYMSIDQTSGGQTVFNISNGASRSFIFQQPAAFVSISADSVSNSTGLAADAFVPSVEDKINLTIASFTDGQYSQVGNVVTMSARLTCIIDTSSTCFVYFSLPVFTAAVSLGQITGTATTKKSGGIVQGSGIIYADLSSSGIYGILEFEGVGGEEWEVSMVCVYQVVS